MRTPREYRRRPTDPVTFTLTDNEARAVLYACSVAGAHPELWNGNETHRVTALLGREKMLAAYNDDSQAVRGVLSSVVLAVD